MTERAPLKYQPENTPYEHELFFPLVERISYMASQYSFQHIHFKDGKNPDWLVSIWQNIGRDPLTRNYIQARLRRRMLYILPSPSSIWVDTRLKDPLGENASTAPEEAAYFWTNGKISTIKVRQYYGGLPKMERITPENIESHLPIATILINRLDQVFPL